jgi:hypothetical protein
MKTWTAISLLNKSGLPVKQKSVYLKKAVQRMNLKLSREHLLAANLVPRDTAIFARKHSIGLSIAEIHKHSNRRWTPNEFLDVARFTQATFADIDAVFTTIFDKTRVMKALNMKVSVEEITTATRIGHEILSYAPFLRETPTVAQIARFTRVSSGVSCFAQACLKFGHPLSFDMLIQKFNPFIPHENIFETITALGVEFPTGYMLDHYYSADLLIRQMWLRACPVVYCLELSSRHGPYAAYKLFRAKRAIRVIQRFARFITKTKAAKKIQRAWRKCASDPRYAVARNRLVREFSEMQ